MGKKLYHTNTAPVETALLVGAISGRGNQGDALDSLQELAQLAETAGATVKGYVTQYLPRPNPATYIGSGKVTEIKDKIVHDNIPTVIFDDDLSPKPNPQSGAYFGMQVDRSVPVNPGYLCPSRQNGRGENTSGARTTGLLAHAAYETVDASFQATRGYWDSWAW